MNNKITLPELSFVMLVGEIGSSFAEKHFKPAELQADTPDLHVIAEKRLKEGKFTVIDATNVQPEARKSLVQLARKYHVPTVALVLQHSPKSLKKGEGITYVHELSSPEVIIQREPTQANKMHEHGPFDIIGDVHGCIDELVKLLKKLGYNVEKQTRYIITHPEKRRMVFVGDLVDRGPNSPEVLRLVMDAVASGIAFCVNGNHDDRLRRKLIQRDVMIAHGLQETLDQLESESAAFKQEVVDFLHGLASYYVFDDGKLAVAHAGLKQHYIGRASPRIRRFCMYGETTGKMDELGLPIRYPWAKKYHGETLIVYGHTPIPHPEWINNTVNIDTGCVFGGKLTALRYPEMELVSIKGAKVYSKPLRPLQCNLQEQSPC